MPHFYFHNKSITFLDIADTIFSDYGVGDNQNEPYNSSAPGDPLYAEGRTGKAEVDGTIMVPASTTRVQWPASTVSSGLHPQQCCVCWSDSKCPLPCCPQKSWRWDFCLVIIELSKILKRRGIEMKWGISWLFSSPTWQGKYKFTDNYY